MSKYAAHQILLNEQVFAAQKEYPNARFYPRHTGVFFTRNGTPITINRPGMSDYWAWFPVNGFTHHIEIEAKSGSAVLSKEQKKWRAHCERMNIQFFLVTSENTLIQQMNAFEKSLKQ